MAKTEKQITFDEIENNIYQFHLQQCRNELVAILTEIDEYLFENRDKELFRVCGHSQKTINTVFGAVSYSRRRYEIGSEDGAIKSVALLDEVLSAKTIGTLTLCMAKKVSELRNQGLSYKGISEEIKDANGIDLTRQAIPGVLLSYKNYEKKVRNETNIRS